MIDLTSPRLLLSTGSFAVGGGIAVLSLAAPSPHDANVARGRAIIFGVVHGLGNGCCSAVFKVAPAKFFGRKHIGQIGGVLQSLNMASTAIGPLMVGSAKDLFGNYAGTLRTISLVTATYGLLALALTEPKRAVRNESAARKYSQLDEEGGVADGARAGGDGRKSAASAGVELPVAAAAGAAPVAC